MNVNKQKLIDWAPAKFKDTFGNTRAYKFSDEYVVEEYNMFEGNWKPWPGKHKNVTSWCVLSNGYAVGWNENPSRGWSFPTMKYEV